MILAVVACLAAVAGIGLLRTPAARDFDALLQPPSTSTSRALAYAASLAHPTDYAYALAEARLEPRSPSGTSTAARLRLLNRAMILCPHCVEAHEEAARDLWRLGRRQQSLLEWKIVVTESRPALWGALAELRKRGASPEELATLSDDANRYDVSRYLLGQGMVDAARENLSQDSNPESAALHLMRAQIALSAKDIPAAQKASQRALELAPHDSRAVLMAADVALLRSNNRDEAMEILEKALRFAPADVELNRRLLSLLMQTDKWQAIDRALANFREALAEAGAPSAEANLAAAHAFERRGQFLRAISEYQAALAQNPDNIGLLLALAKAAEETGGMTTALDAYNAILRRDPTNAEARGALARIQRDKKQREVDSISPPP
jgi:tetratricopeptide (TPR) repeat protein